MFTVSLSLSLNLSLSQNVGHTIFNIFFHNHFTSLESVQTQQKSSRVWIQPWVHLFITNFANSQQLFAEDVFPHFFVNKYLSLSPYFSLYLCLSLFIFLSLPIFLCISVSLFLSFSLSFTSLFPLCLFPSFSTPLITKYYVLYV